MEDSVYGAYGATFRTVGQKRSAYAGATAETDTGCYILDARVYDPAIPRFLNPDSASPFGTGGINRYAYCGGDPINRTDPSGSTWQGWPFLASKGLTSGTNVADKMLASRVTPCAERIAIASVSDVAVVTSAIGAGASAATANPRAESIFGALSPATVATKSSESAARSGGSPSYGTRTERTGWIRFLGKSQSRQRPAKKPITVISDPKGRDVFHHRNGRRYIEPEWHERQMSLRGGGAVNHWLADAPLVTTHILKPLQRISAALPPGSHTDVYVYTGVHGLDNGENWVNGRRAYSAPLLSDDLKTIDILRNSASNLNIHSEMIFGVSARSMEQRMQRPGHHIHAYCFSAVDSLVTATLNIDPLPIYNIP